MSDDSRCTDDELRAIVERTHDPLVRSAVAELLAIRSERRRDSRRAEQIRRMRWVTENQLTKLEVLAKNWGEEEMAKSEEPEVEG